MRIGMVLDNEFTGDPRVENEVLSLREAGIDVSVLCYSFGDKPLKEDFHGANIIRFKINKRFKDKIKGLNNTIFNFYPVLWARKITDFIESELITHIHVHDLWMIEGTLRANKKYRLPIVADLHENFVYALGNYKYSTTFPGKYLISQDKWKKDEVKWLDLVDHIVVVIEEAKQRLIDLGIDKEKISVVQNYVNIAEFTNDNKELTLFLREQNKGKYTITYTGGFDIHRGLDIVIRAAALLQDKIPELQVNLVGGGSVLDDLKGLVHELSLEEVVKFPGYLPHQELPSYVKASDCCIIPHLKNPHTDNTIPHKLFQYMIMERPIVATNCDPIERIVLESDSGLVYTYDDPQSCADAIYSLYSSEQNKYGLNGKQAVINQYNWKEASKCLISLYE